MGDGDDDDKEFEGFFIDRMIDEGLFGRKCRIWRDGGETRQVARGKVSPSW